MKEKNKEMQQDDAATAADDNGGKEEVNKEDESNVFKWECEGNEESIDPIGTILYLIDFDFARHCPVIFRDLRDNFKFAKCLPGGDHCMTSCTCEANQYVSCLVN